MPSLIKQNIVANFGGRIWMGLMSLAFVPIYIHFMGMEAYGLVGAFASLQAVFSLFDLGLSTTMNREMARLSVLPDRVSEMRDLVRTLETSYWGIGLVIGIAVVILSSPLAYHWLRGNKLSPSTIQHALMITGGVLAFQWPASLYMGGLMGLQKQVLLNGIESGVATLRGVGAVLVLWLVSPTIVAFFTWQIFVSLFRTSIMAAFLWRSITLPGHRPYFKKNILVNIWRFAAGMTGISITALILTQTDKIILSKLLTLEIFGYYSLAKLVANTLYRFIGPVYGALFPRFSQLVSLHDQDALKDLYHKSCQLMSVMILPAAIVVSFFSSEILLLWTRNPLIVTNTHSLVSILIIGTALNGLMNLPYGLQLAYGWTKLALYANIIASIILVPMIYVLCTHYGPVGAATAWVILNSGYVLIGIQIMHCRLLPKEKWTWYGKDVGMPLIAALLTAGLGRFLINEPMTNTGLVFSIMAVSMATLCASTLVTPAPRAWVFAWISKARMRYCPTT